MKKILGSSLILLSSSLFAGTITTVEHGNTANGYQLVFKNVGVKPTSFNTDSSIVLDFPNTTSALKTRGVDITSNGIYNVDVIQGQGKTRAVINLSSAKVYDVRLQGQDVVVTVAGNRKALSNAASNPVAQISRPTAVKTSNTSYSGLNPIFRRSANDRGAFTIKLPSANTLVDVRNEGSQIVLGLSGVNISRKDQKRLDVRDYGTPVSFVDITKSPSGSKVAINMGKNSYEYVSYQTRDTYTVEVFKPAPEESSEKKVQELLGFGDGKNYKGEPISLNFQDIEVRAVLQIIAEFTHTNIVVSDGVTGNITLRLDNVPWDQALDIIMKTKGLDKRRSGQIIYVATTEELRNSELGVLTLLREKAQLTPTRIEKIQVQYASADELKNTILQMQQVARYDGQNNAKSVDSVLSERGSITAEPRTNMLIVNDIPEKIVAIRKLVEELDKPVKQVLVDARIVLTKDNFGRDFGIKFGTSFINRNSNSVIGGSGTLSAANSLANSVVAGDSPIKAPDISSRLGVNFPVSSGGTSPASYGLAILSGDFLVDLELSALQTEGRVEIVSSPRVVTQDGTAARVWNGVEVPLVTKDDKGNSQILKDTASLSLDVTPRIAPNHMVNMDLNINNDAIAGTVSVAGQTQFTKTVSGVTTSVLVDNGETIVLGGVYQQRQEKADDKIPVLGDIPVIGNAFKTHRRSFNKDEMLIFVTPRIVDKRLIDQDKFSNLRD